jgi:hypothetical protein
MIHRLFTRNTQNHPQNALEDRVLALEGHVTNLKARMNELEETLAALAGAHAKLRNKFYGELSGSMSQNRRDPVAAIPFGDKTGLRRALGILPASGNRGGHNDGE